MTMPSVRIGLLAPPPNVVMEVEFPPRLPADASLHTMRVPRSTSAVTPDSLLEMTTNIEAATRCIAMMLPKLIAFGCTSASFIEGSAGIANSRAASPTRPVCPRSPPPPRSCMLSAPWVPVRCCW